MGRLVLGIPGRRHYLSALRSIFGSSLIGLWLQNEQAGSVCRDYSPYAHNGTYSGVTLAAARGPRGLFAPSYDGANDYTNIYSASLVSAFNGQEGTVIAWARVSGAGVWTDGVSHDVVNLQADASNYVVIRKATANNTIALRYGAGGVDKSVYWASGGTLTWACYAITWSKSANQVAAYINSGPTGTATGLGTWAGSPASTTTNIGAFSTTPVNPWSGLIGPVILLNRAATPAEIAAAYNAGLPVAA